jgi:hypothetical protein
MSNRLPAASSQISLLPPHRGGPARHVDRNDVTRIELDAIARGEFAENAIRKGFLPSEIDAIRRALEPIERAAAKRRRGGDHRGNSGKFPELGQARDRIGSFASVAD